MMRTTLILGIAAILFSCKAPLSITNIQAEKNIRIGQSIPEDGAMKTLIEPYKKSLETQMNAKISYTSVELNKQGDNSNLGNLLADYTLIGGKEWAAKNNIAEVDAAVINIGGIRSTIGKGDILLKHIYEVMPFENELVLVKMTGAQMQNLFKYYQETQKNNPVSGLRIEVNGKKSNFAFTNGKNISPEKTYYIVTSDYLALGGDKMSFFTQGEMMETGIKLRDLYIELFKRNPEIKAPKDIRLIFKK